MLSKHKHCEPVTFQTSECLPSVNVIPGFGLSFIITDSNCTQTHKKWDVCPLTGSLFVCHSAGSDSENLLHIFNNLLSRCKLNCVVILYYLQRLRYDDELLVCKIQGTFWFTRLMAKGLLNTVSTGSQSPLNSKLI